jgi:hypothetical protein
MNNTCSVLLKGALLYPHLIEVISTGIELRGIQISKEECCYDRNCDN